MISPYLNRPQRSLDQVLDELWRQVFEAMTAEARWPILRRIGILIANR